MPIGQSEMKKKEKHILTREFENQSYIYLFYFKTKNNFKIERERVRDGESCKNKIQQY
jgi:hypothetical protein